MTQAPVRPPRTQQPSNGEGRALDCGQVGPELLQAHLADWLGAWPPAVAVKTVGCASRTRPGWDGQLHPLLGVAGPAGLVLSVPPQQVSRVTRAIQGFDPGEEEFTRALTRASGLPGRPVTRLAFRWCTAPAPLEDHGRWLEASDPAVPPWLRRFNGRVLVAFDDAGVPISGVGIKKHNRLGHELAVATSARARGRGLAAALVAQAARRVLDDGAVPTYLHLMDNHASARTADASGFTDLGWIAFALQDAREGATEHGPAAG